MEVKIPYGIKGKNVGEKETVISVRDTSERKREASRGAFVQDRVTVKMELCHVIGSQAHGGWYR